MGCSPSKPEAREEATPVKLCRDRRDFVKRAVRQRDRFGDGLVAYLESLARVSVALREFVDAYDNSGRVLHLVDSYAAAFPASPVKRWVPREDDAAAPIGSVGERDRSVVPMLQTKRSDYHPISPHRTGRRLELSSTAVATNSNQTTSPETCLLSDSPHSTRCSSYAHGSICTDPSGSHQPPPATQTAWRLRIWPGNRETTEEEFTPSYTAYLDRRASSIPEATAEIAYQFERIQDFCEEMKEMLEVNSGRRQNRFAAAFIGGSVTSSPRASSSRHLLASPEGSDRDSYGEGGTAEREPSSEEGPTSTSIVLRPTASHRATLRRLYEWEKMLYEEVKEEDKTGREYDRRWAQLHQHDAMGADPFVIDRTRRAIRDLHSQVKMSLRSIQAISARIEALRDEELYPQIIHLIHGLRRMWAVMADCHRTQVLLVENAKLLLDEAPSESRPPPPAVAALSFSAAKLQSEIRNWRARLQKWLTAHRAYAQSLAGWVQSCAPSEPAAADANDSQQGEERFPPPPIVATCIEWAKFLEPAQRVDIRTSEVLEKFAAEVGVLVVGRRREGRWVAWRRQAEVEVVAELDEEAAEHAVTAVFTGLGAAVESLAELAGCYRDGYRNLAGRTEDDWMRGRTPE